MAAVKVASSQRNGPAYIRKRSDCRVANSRELHSPGLLSLTLHSFNFACLGLDRERKRGDISVGYHRAAYG